MLKVKPWYDKIQKFRSLESTFADLWFDYDKATSIASEIAKYGFSGDQVKGRIIDITKCSEMKKEEFDKMVDAEVKNGYETAKRIIEDESELHQLLVDALLEFKTLYQDDIELLLTDKSLEKLREFKSKH